jgi:hypothetical protein
MTVLARSKSGVNRIKRHRQARSGRTTSYGTSTPRGMTPETAPGMRRRRELGGMQDEAVYTCQCGFVFHAPVSTSVGCPQCGGSQAW